MYYTSTFPFNYSKVNILVNHKICLPYWPAYRPRVFLKKIYGKVWVRPIRSVSKKKRHFFASYGAECYPILHLFPPLYRFQLSLNSFPTFLWHSKLYSPLLVADKHFPCLENLKRIKKKKKVNITVYKSRKQVRKKYWDIYNCVSTSLTTFLSSAMLKPQSDIF